MADGAPARFATPVEGGKLLCTLCPRGCRVGEGQRAFCFVRENVGGEMRLTTYGRSSGFCVDPIEKKPLAHFYPGTSVLSFGTAGCNLGCKFCQNWDISKAREQDRLADAATPDAIAAAAAAAGCTSVAFTYNDPVIWAEYAIDVAAACRARGIKTVAVTAGYVTPSARPELFAAMDAANVDLKAFTDDFYRTLAAAHLAPVLDTLRWLRHESDVWFEITTLLIPGKNDGEDEISRMCDWLAANVGLEVPLHFTAFHPDWKMRDVPPTPPATVRRARRQALAAGLKHVYTGNIHDPEGQGTACAACGAPLIERDGYDVRGYHLDAAGACRACGVALAGRWGTAPGRWGSRRQRLRIV